MYSSVRHALMKLVRSSNSWHISHAYRGIVPAALGAIPSSALYFGAYEYSKRALSGILLQEDDIDGANKESSSSSSAKQRLLIHGLAAACGNTISSAVFVPKEVIKQQLQIQESSSLGSVVTKLLHERGIGGLYVGYQATLMRNIPSAIMRFVLYEELKRKWTFPTTTTTSRSQQQEQDSFPLPPSVRVFAAGAVAGALASGIMTPVDVLKTRLATGTCPLGVKNCFLHTLNEAGWKGLYAGAGSRMMWSGAFSAIGFGTFELVKQSLGVADGHHNSNSNNNNNKLAPAVHGKR
jgi:solute carrier family 25 S-adenosylmethionine transporter 26